MTFRKLKFRTRASQVSWNSLRTFFIFVSFCSSISIDFFCVFGFENQSGQVKPFSQSALQLFSHEYVKAKFPPLFHKQRRNLHFVFFCYCPEHSELQFGTYLLTREGVPLSSTHQFHTKGPLLFSPKNPSVPHQKPLSSTQPSQFHTKNPSVPHQKLSVPPPSH